MVAHYFTMYVNIAYSLWTLIFLVWLFFSFSNKQTTKREGLGEQFVALALLFVSFALLFNPQVVVNIFGEKGIGQNPLLGIVGDFLTLVSVLFAIWARVILGKNWSGAVITVKKDHQLIQTGPYAYVRHPIYTGFIFAAFGTALTIGLSGSFVAAEVMVLAFLIRMPREEEFMTQQFPEEYPLYKQRVKKIIPFLW